MPSLGDLCTPERAEPLFAEAVPLLSASLTALAGRASCGLRHATRFPSQHLMHLSSGWALALLRPPMLTKTGRASIHPPGPRVQGQAALTHCCRPPPGLETARPDVGPSQLPGGYVLILRPHSQDRNRQMWRLRLRLSPQGQTGLRVPTVPPRAPGPCTKDSPQLRPHHPQGHWPPKCKPSQPGPSTQGLLGRRVRIPAASCPTSPRGWRLGTGHSPHSRDSIPLSRGLSGPGLGGLCLPQPVPFFRPCCWPVMQQGPGSLGVSPHLS